MNISFRCLPLSGHPHTQQIFDCKLPANVFHDVPQGMHLVRENLSLGEGSSFCVSRQIDFTNPTRNDCRVIFQIIKCGLERSDAGIYGHYHALYTLAAPWAHEDVIRIEFSWSQFAPQWQENACVEVHSVYVTPDEQLQRWYFGDGKLVRPLLVSRQIQQVLTWWAEDMTNFMPDILYAHGRPKDVVETPVAAVIPDAVTEWDVLD